MTHQPDAAARLSGLRALPDEELGRHLPAGRVLGVRLREQFEALLEAELTIRAGGETGVHDVRVACRRLVAGLATLRPLVRTVDNETLRAELRWLARSLGAARDQDVAYERLLELALSQPDGQDAGWLIELVRPQARPHHPDHPLGSEVLDTERYAGLLATLGAFVTDPPWTPAAQEDAGPFVLGRIVNEWDRLAREVSVVLDAEPGSASDEHLHDARKAAKRMRYALEVAELLWPRAPKALHKRVHRLTDVLGEHQDTVLTRAALSDLAARAERAREPTLMHGRLQQLEAARAAELEASFRREWSRAAETRRHWP